MIDCETCKDWFHDRCITFICDQCRSKNDNLKSESTDKMQAELTKIQKEKAKDEVLKKKYVDENNASKAMIKDLEKKLAAKNKALESMTLSCQK